MDKNKAILVLGYSFDDSWNLPDHLKQRLEFVAQTVQQDQSLQIIVCGKYSIHWEWEQKEPPVTESGLMKDILIDHGVEEDRIFLEQESMDTPGNIYFAKKNIMIPKNINDLLVYCATHHETRVKFLLQKILGPDYNWEVITTDSPGAHSDDLMQHEAKILKEQYQWMTSMKDGDHAWLDGKLYDDPYYTDQIKNDRRKSDRVATIYLANK